MKKLQVINCMLVGAVALAFCVDHADAEIVSGVNKDAYVQSGSEADNNFGTATQLLAKNHSSGSNFDRKSYLGFDTTSFSASDFGWKLTLNVVDSGLGDEDGSNTYSFSVYGLDHGGDDSWDQSAITWNNAAGNNTASGNGFGAGTTLLGSFDITGKGIGSTIMFSSAAFDTFMNGVDDQVTLMVARDTLSPPQYVHAFGASEGQNGASLSAVPEPTSFAMFGLALVGFARRRRS